MLPLRLEISAAAVFVLVLTWLATGGPAQAVHQPTPKEEENLRRGLQDYVGDPNSDGNKATRYFSAFVDLRDDGVDDAIVYLSDDGWCGSGGCTTLVLAPEGSSYRVVTRLTITRPPILVLATKSHGWHDIGVWMQGGGIQPGYEAEFSFSGKSYLYRGEPTLQPSERLRERVLPGKVVVPRSAVGKPLYP